MGGLAMLAIWILVRLLSEGKNDNGNLTSLNLSSPESDRENGYSSYEAVTGPEPGVDTSFDEFFETYYRNRWSTNDVLRFLRIFLTTTCYSAPEGSIELATYFFARISKDRAELVPAYEKELSEVGGKGAEVLLEILRQAGGIRTREFLEKCVRDDNYSGIRGSLTKVLELPFPQFQSGLLRPIRTGLDLDLLWCEFLARDRPSRCAGSSMSSTGRILSEQGFRNGGRRRKAASADGRRFGGSESCRKRSSSASMELGSLQRKTSIAASVLTAFKRIANEQRKFVRFYPSSSRQTS